MGLKSDDEYSTTSSSSDDEEDCGYPIEEIKYVIADWLNNLERDEFIRMLQQLSPKRKLLVEPILQSLVNDESNEDCVRAIVQFLSDDKGTPLHYAACRSAHNLTAALLYHGEDPNVRVDWNDDLKQALPLNVVLHCLDRELEMAYGGKGHRHPDRKFSSFKLICELCTGYSRPYLETARLLALQTKDLDREIHNYLDQGKVVELCAFMLLGYDKKVPSPYYIEGDKPVKEVMEVFTRIGDKLQSYVTLKPPPSKNHIGGMVSEIGSIFKDAGLPVKNKDSLVYSEIYDGLKWIGINTKILSRINNGGSNLGGINCSHMARDVTQGSCSFHTSSVLKAHRGVAQSSQDCLVRKPHFWWNPSFLMKAFRRGIKHV